MVRTEDIPYIVTIAAGFVVIILAIAKAALWPGWFGRGSVYFICWPMAAALATTAVFAAVKIMGAK